MRRQFGLAMAALALLGAAPKPAPSPLLLNAGDFDPALLLPPPPADDSPLGRAELAELRRIDAARSAADMERARTDGATKDVTIFAAIVGPGFDIDRLPATKSLFQTIRAEEKAAVDRAKAYFLRNRPWIVDPTLHVCGKEDDAPQSSYPSGHTTLGYAMGAVLARLLPAKAPAIMARAADYAHNRLVCEVHFPSDVVAGQTFGMLVAERLMEQPALRRQFMAAKMELAAAGLQ